MFGLPDLRTTRRRAATAARPRALDAAATAALLPRAGALPAPAPHGPADPDQLDLLTAEGKP